MYTSDQQRLKDIMKESLASPSSVDAPADSVKTQDLAFALEYLLGPKDKRITDLSKAIVAKTPILGLTQAVILIERNDKQDMDEQYRAAQDIVEQYRSHSDVDARKQLHARLPYLEYCIFAAETSDVSVQRARKGLWAIMMKHILNPLVVLPDNIDKSISNHVIKKRCGKQPVFMDRTHRGNEILAEVARVSQPLNAKDQLCPMIHALNTVSMASLKQSTIVCLNLLKTTDPGKLGFTTKDDPDFVILSKEADRFAKALNEWDRAGTYDCTDETCPNGETTTRAFVLRGLAEDTAKYAKTCKGMVDKRLQQTRRETGTSLSWSERVRRMF